MPSANPGSTNTVCIWALQCARPSPAVHGNINSGRPVSNQCSDRAANIVSRDSSTGRTLVQHRACIHQQLGSDLYLDIHRGVSPAGLHTLPVLGFLSELNLVTVSAVCRFRGKDNKGNYCAPAGPWKGSSQSQT